jgi:hypothetical protein
VYLVEILLPLADNDGHAFAPEKFVEVRKMLTERFGGMTAFSRTPAKGTTKEGGEVVHDDIVVFEVLIEELDRNWWSAYRKALEAEFAQDEIMIRASVVTQL